MLTRTSVIYLRVSSELQVQGTSLQSQEETCLRQAQALNSPVLRILRDEGVSGARYFTREGIQQALELIETGQAYYLIVAKVDRAGRDVDALRDIRRRVNKFGELVFADGMQFANDAGGNLMYNITGSFAEYERQVIRDRTSSGKRKAAENGTQPARAWSPFGYVLDKQTGVYAVHEPHRAIVAELFARYEAGQSLREIGKWLDAAQIPTQQGGFKWHGSTLTKILGNPVYKGLARYGSSQWSVDESRRERGFKSLTVGVPTPERTISIPCPAIVDADLWERVQRRRNDSQALNSGNPTAKYLLSGLLRCPACGTRMIGTTDNHYKDRERGRKYLCRRHTCKDTRQEPDCKRVALRQTEADEAVLGRLLQLAESPRVWENCLQAWQLQQRRHRATPSLAQEAEAKLHELASEERRLVQAQIAGMQAGASAEAYQPLFIKLAQERAFWQAQQASQADRFEEEVLRTDAGLVQQGLHLACRILISTANPIVQKRRVVQSVLTGIYPCEPKRMGGFRLELQGTVHQVSYRCTVAHNTLQLELVAA